MARRLRRLTLAAVLAAPLLIAPIATPAVALADAGPFGYSSQAPYGSAGGYSAYEYGGLGGYGGTYGGSGGYGSFGGYGSGTSTGTATTTETSDTATDAESSGVVLIDTTLDYGEGEAAGTGLVIGSDGIVVTNHHVVAGSTGITVTDPSTGKQYAATVVGYDTTADVAVLKLADASGLTTVTTDTDAASTGEDVTAVGNAEGGGQLMAADGDVTATDQDITVSDDEGGSESLADLIEVAAYVVPGDSGGALLDGDGEVIGMNVAASTGGYDVSGYAIPIATVLDVASEIEAHQSSADLAYGYGAALGVTVASGTGAVVAEGIVDGGAADSAGMTAGSTITSVDGTSISTLSDLTDLLARHRAGDRVQVAWTDADGGSHHASVTLGRAPLA